ncbi:MAG: aspartate/glutamate racemase family protein [Variovorax sp.]
MPSLLVINPNTSSSVSAVLQRHVQYEVGDAVEVHTATARFGAPYISSEASYAVANHTVLDAWAVALTQRPKPDAVLIGCFGDPGLFALREGAGVPVGGLAEAAFAAAAWHGRFAIVTGGERWRPMLSRLAGALGHTQTLAGIHTVAPTGAELADDPVGARKLLAEACCEAADRFKAQAVILGGAGLAGMAADIAAQVPVPLIDSVQAGAQWAVEALRGARREPGDSGFGVHWENVSWEMAALP